MGMMEEFGRKRLLKHLSWKGVCPKRFRIWDELHHRWFQGDISKKSRQLQTDAINFFGEIMIMEGVLFDQNEDDAWKNSPEVHSTIDMLDHLIVVQDTGQVDVNGVSIFEGDILITDDNLIGYVAYDKEMGGYMLYSPYHGCVLTMFDTCTYKGNIFQHYDMWFKDLDNEEKWCSCCKDFNKEKK